MNRIDLIIFDCDGVLIDSEIISANVLMKQLVSVGIPIDLDHIFRNFIGYSYPAVAKSIETTFGKSLPQDFESQYYLELHNAFMTDLHVMAGIHDVLSELSVDYCLATSSTPVRLKQSLEIVGLTDAFEKRLFTASEVKKGKPAPDLFLLAAKTMGFQPENCLVIEDSPSGIAAGQAAGMAVWQFTGGSHFKIARDMASACFPGIKTFDKWSRFFALAPELRKHSPGNEDCHE